jgi:hypothetical protein
MGLVKFKDFLGGKGTGKTPPSVIRADDLDGNFKMLQVIESDQTIYKVDMSDNGQKLNFIAGNRAVRWIEIDVCVNGVAKKMMVLATNPY